MIYGVDRSAVQGRVRARDLVAQNIRFTIDKATEGAGGSDPVFEANVDDALTEGLGGGAYAYLSSQTSGAVQAKHFIEKVGDARLKVLRAMADFESPLFAGMGSRAMRTADDFCRTVENQQGKPCIVYTGKWFMRSLGAGWDADPAVVDRMAARPYLHAEYPSLRRGGGRTRAEYEAVIAELTPETGPHLADLWVDRGYHEIAWQFDGNGGLVLPSGVDCDFDVFHGSEEDFQAFFFGPPSAAPRPAPAPAWRPSPATIQDLLLVGDRVDPTPDGIRAFQRSHGLAADGIVGTRTIRALVVDFQRDRKIRVDGVIGPQTLDALHALAA